MSHTPVNRAAPSPTGSARLRDRISDAIRTGASSRHVPDEILAVRALPHARTDKKLEVPVKRLLQGAPAKQALNPAAVDNPELIAYFVRLGAERNKRSTHPT
jgi:acetoacetyl-CoA synthetase